jgi:pheromone shutdown protein TraB
MEEFSTAFPSIKEALIHERDLYLTERIRTAPGKKIVAIVGAGHCPGIKANIDSKIATDKLEIVPKPGWSKVLTKWGVPLLLLGAVLYVFFTSGSEVGVRYLWIWSVVAAFYAALGCLVTVAHPVTAIITVVTAPFTMWVPIFKPGLVGAVVETYIRRPRVLDMETVLEDMGHLKGWYNNRVAHVFLIFLVNNIIKWPAVGTLGILGLSGAVG